jgi:hypothetical protein
MTRPYAHVLNFLLSILICLLYIDNYIIDNRVGTSWRRSLTQAVSRTAEGLSRTQAIRIYNGQNGNGTGFFRVRRISPVGILAPVLHVHPSSVTETNFSNSNRR